MIEITRIITTGYSVIYDNEKRNGQVELKIGEKYKVSPLNEKKKKHRGRVGILLSFDEDFMPSIAEIKFIDTNRTGKVDITDLIPDK